MTLPTLVGHVDTYGTGSAARVLTPPSGTIDGDLMIVVMTSNAITYTPPSGWTQMYLVTTGTMKTTAWRKFRATGETAASATYSFTPGSSATDIASILSFRGVEASLAHLVVGATGDRGSTGTSTTNVAPSITTTVADTKVYTFSSERTTASETGITSVSPGTADYFKVQNGSTGVETFSVSHLDMASTGASGAVTITYPNTQALNGLAVQIGIPGISSNAAPVAGFSTSVAALVLTVTSTATDSDGTIASTDYDWGDSTTHGSTANGTHTYASAGTYTVTQTVTDNLGATNSTSHSVTVSPSNVAPVAAFSAVVTGMTVAVTDASTDSDGTISSYDWDWGDGTTHGTGSSPAAHQYTTSGTKSITLLVTDNGSATNSASHSVNINTFGQDGKWVKPDGTVVSGKLFYWDGTTKKDLTFDTITRIARPMTVSEFLNYPVTGPWEAAHRGGSYVYPEETLYSYRGSTDRGVMAIELSCQVSLDGTWWAFHDAYLDRTVLPGNPSTTTLQISAMHDVAIAAYSNNAGTATANTGQPARAVAKVVDVIDAYYKTHVIIIEDKTYTHTTSMLDLLDSYGTSGRPASEIFIWKATYDATKSTNFDAAALRGYHRWAYIFDSNMVADFATLVSSGKADIIGMDYQSSDATLVSAIAACKTAGLKPTAHIINSVTQRDRLLGLGMEGIMYSNVFAIPVKQHKVLADFRGITQSATNGYIAAQAVSIFDAASPTFTVQTLGANVSVAGTWSNLATSLVSGQYRGTQSLTAGQFYNVRIKAVTASGTYYSNPQRINIV